MRILQRGYLASSVLTLFLLMSSIPVLADVERASTSQIALKLCKTTVELDCIESIQYRYGNSAWSNIKLIRAPEGSFKDEYGQTVENSGSVWSFKDSNGQDQQFVITTTLNGEGYKSPAYKKLYPAMWFTFLDLPMNSINSGISFKTTIRTSWLKPQGVGLIAAKSSFDVSDIRGGKRYVFIGSPFLSTSLDSPEKFAALNSPTQEMTKSDKEIVSLYFVVDHHSSIPGGTFWDPTCADSGYSVTSHNAIGAGQPYMSDNETLKFNIGAPHRFSNGELNRGFFSTDIHTAYLNCRWPDNTLTKSPRIEVSILNQDGTSQIATTSVAIEKGILKVRATGFHYSSPTIVLKASENLALPSLQNSEIVEVVPPISSTKIAESKKSYKIKCIKGKSTKVFTNTTGRCPVGWKKTSR